MNTALILVDIQNDYFPGGKWELANTNAAAEQAAKALAWFRERGLPTVHIQHIFKGPDAPFFAENTSGAEIHASIAPKSGETHLIKHYPNSFRETPLLEHLNKLGVKQLAITGMMTAMCIDATARAAADYGFENFLLHDAMATRDLEYNGEIIPAAKVHGAYLASLGWAYGKLQSVKDFIAKS